MVIVNWDVSRGIVIDFDGFFSLEVEIGDVFEILYMGYEVIS